MCVVPKMDKLVRHAVKVSLTQRSAAVAFSTTSPTGYKINYDQLRGDGTAADVPNTVKANVKNVSGWRGGAERGFRAAYTDIIHVLTSEGTTEMPEMSNWYRKVLTHNLSSSVLSQRYGMLVPITYKQLKPSASKDEMQLAHILGWSVELIRASATVATDTMASNSAGDTDRYGSKKDPEKLTWAEKHGLGNKAFNDALLIDRGVYVLIKHFFGSAGAALFYEPVVQAQRSRVLGRALGQRLLDYEKKTKRLDEYNIKNYKNLVRSHVSHTNYCLPISLALHLAGLHEEKIHEKAHTILHEIGYYVELTRDFTNCFVDPVGTDIHDGRLTWLIVLALQRANPDQRDCLELNYGHKDAEKVEAVMKVYKELKLKKLLGAHIKVKKSDNLDHIQGISGNIYREAGLSQEFFFKLMDNMNFMKFIQ